MKIAANKYQKVIDALRSLPKKRLISGSYHFNEDVCVIGAIKDTSHLSGLENHRMVHAVFRKGDFDHVGLSIEDTFDIQRFNDNYSSGMIAPEERYRRVMEQLEKGYIPGDGCDS